MYPFAQTNLQLYRQMAELDYTAQERERVAVAYRFLMPTFSAMYRGTEKPFIAHLVGTASILAAHRVRIELVLAGLLHAVYTVGDFGFQPGTRQTRRKQSVIREVAGEETERIVTTYDRLGLDLNKIETCVREHAQRTEVERDAVVLLLANTLEDLLDFGAQYCVKTKLEPLSSPDMKAALVSLARQYGCPRLTRDLEKALASLGTVSAPIDPRQAMGESRLILPPSSSRDLLPTAIGWSVRRLRRLQARLSQGFGSDDK